MKNRGIEPSCSASYELESNCTAGAADDGGVIKPEIAEFIASVQAL